MSSHNSVDELVLAKICSMVILSATSLIAGILPIKLGYLLYRNPDKKKVEAFEKVMSFFLHFGAGVLLCTIFLHLMPDMREQMDTIKTKIDVFAHFNLSYADLLVCVGFFLIYTIEQGMHSHVGHDHEITIAPTVLAARTENDFELRNKCTTKTVTVNSLEKSVNYKIVENGDTTNNQCSEHKHIKDGLCDHKNYHSCENHLCSGGIVEHESHTAIVGHDVHHEHIPDFSDSISSGLLIVMALSLHEVFEGMTVGLEDEPAMVWYLLAAISCHKSVLSAFIGLQLLATKSKLFVSYIFITVYAITSSVGIFIGLLVSLCSEQNDYVALASVSLQGIATGTLLYVVFFEIYLKNEGTHQLSGFLKAISSITGFIFMAFLQVQLSN